jgi:hypothetical protein
MDGIQSALLKASINKWISPLAGHKIDAVKKRPRYLINAHWLLEVEWESRSPRSYYVDSSLQYDARCTSKQTPKFPGKQHSSSACRFNSSVSSSLCPQFCHALLHDVRWSAVRHSAVSICLGRKFMLRTPGHAAVGKCVKRRLKICTLLQTLSGCAS